MNELDISNLFELKKALEKKDLCVIGSGGSLSIAYLLKYYHVQFNGKMCYPMTPFELVETLPPQKNISYWFVSAGGRNIDINNSCKRLLAFEPSRVIATCARKSSPLIDKVSKTHNSFSFELPCGKDGFLATNSILAFAILIHRFFELKNRLPSNFWKLIDNKILDEYIEYLRNKLFRVLSKKNLILLHGSATHAAAVDLESKFTEAALGSVLKSDYRNFGHGRHHWLAKHGESTGVIAMCNKDDQEIAKKTIALLPKSISKEMLFFQGTSSISAIKALLAVQYITFIKGEIEKIDPGRPGVPSFGRKLYHLRGISAKNPELKLDRKSVAIRRKLNNLSSKTNQKKQSYYEEGYNKFLKKPNSN